jgi:hypothetical protein
MLILKTSFQIHDLFLNQLSQLIHGEIKYISSFGKKVDLSSEYDLYDRLFLGVSKEEASFILSIQALFYQSENIPDDVNTLQAMFEGEDRKKEIEFNIAPIKQPPFKIQKIKIFGQERTLTWSDGKKTSYFNQKIPRDIGDYYFNNTILRFESSDDRYINFFVERYSMGLGFQKELQVLNDFYRVDELFMGIEFIPEAVYTNVQKIKCHYEIDENGIAKNVKGIQYF